MTWEPRNAGTDDDDDDDGDRGDEIDHENVKGEKTFSEINNFITNTFTYRTVFL